MLKRICIAILPFLVASMLSGCMLLNGGFFYNDNVHESLGEYTDNEIYMSDDWIDTNYYEKYYYSSSPMSDNDYFILLTSRYTGVFFEYIDEYEASINFDEPVNELDENYNFDRSIVDSQDYFYIYDFSMKDDFYSPFQNFFIYFFDTQTNVLYYFEANT